MKFSRLIWANLTRKKVRLILTIGSFAVVTVKSRPAFVTLFWAGVCARPTTSGTAT